MAQRVSRGDWREKLLAAGENSPEPIDHNLIQVLAATQLVLLFAGLNLESKIEYFKPLFTAGHLAQNLPPLAPNWEEGD